MKLFPLLKCQFCCDGPEFHGGKGGADVPGGGGGIIGLKLKCFLSVYEYELTIFDKRLTYNGGPPVPGGIGLCSPGGNG